MTLPEAERLFEYWRVSPPEHELVAMVAQVYTTWRPNVVMTPEQHRKSLEERWAGGAMNVKQMFEAMGGALSLDGRAGPSLKGAALPGIGSFPGAH